MRTSQSSADLTLDIPMPDMDSIISIDQSAQKPEKQRSFACSQPNLLLPIVKNDILPRISASTLANYLNGSLKVPSDVFIIDCRFSYEYDGGHIKSAINISSPVALQKQFFDIIKPNSIIIFHCEFSHNRGPKLAAYFRDEDRRLNYSCHPKLYYPDVYILDGGYSNFYAEHQDLCIGGYTKMMDSCHIEDGDLITSTHCFRKGLMSRSSSLSGFSVQNGGRSAPIKHSSHIFCPTRSDSITVPPILA